MPKISATSGPTNIHDQDSYSELVMEAEHGPELEVPAAEEVPADAEPVEESTETPTAAPELPLTRVQTAAAQTSLFEPVSVSNPQRIIIT